jgi:hypothetical protein
VARQKGVSLLSSIHTATVSSTGELGWKTEVIRKPDAVVEYNLSMDRLARSLHLTSVQRKMSDGIGYFPSSCSVLQLGIYTSCLRRRESRVLVNCFWNFATEWFIHFWICTPQREHSFEEEDDNSCTAQWRQFPTHIMPAAGCIYVVCAVRVHGARQQDSNMKGVQPLQSIWSIVFMLIATALCSNDHHEFLCVWYL